MSALGEAIRAEAEISSRPAQLERLQRIATMVEELEESLEASRWLSNQLVAGLKEQQAEAWDEGHLAHAPFLEEGETPCDCANPYRED